MTQTLNKSETHKNRRFVTGLLPSMTSSLERRRLKNRTGIIHALDVEELDSAVKIAVRVAPYVDAIKLSWPLVMKYGVKTVIGEIKPRISLPIIACFKVGDIPYISNRIVDIATSSGADGITLQGIVGKDTMKECIRIAHKNDSATWMVTEMSHPGAEEFMQPVGGKIARMAKELESDGIVAPATRPEQTKKYREIVGDDVMIMSPGIGAQGGRIGDAILAGADFEVVGRRIWDTEDPAKEAKRYSEEMARVRKKIPLVRQ